MLEPYYQKDGITIYHGDCLEVMPQLDIKFDLCLTDPPYGTKDGRGKVHKLGDKIVEFNVGEWDKKLLLEWIKWGLNLLREGCWIAVFTDNLSVKTVWDEIEEAGGRCKQTFYWIKSNPVPHPRKNFCSGVETAVVATKGAVQKWYGGGWYKNYYVCPIVTSHKRTPHPTQKPIRVMAYLQNALTKEGDIIIDPFMGSGTTLVVARNENRRAVGIELSEKYCEMAAYRLENKAEEYKAKKNNVSFNMKLF